MGPEEGYLYGLPADYVVSGSVSSRVRTSALRKFLKFVLKSVYFNNLGAPTVGGPMYR